MSLIERFAALDAEILELAQVKGYQRHIGGKLTTVKSAERGGPSAGAQGGKPDDPPNVDQILSKRVPVHDLTDVQRYLLKQRATAYKDIVDRHKKLRGAVTDEYSQARDVLHATANYYEALASNNSSYDDRENLRVDMEIKRVKLRQTAREKIRLQAAVTPQQGGTLPAVW